MYKRFINQLQMYAKVITVPSRSYLQISLLPPSKMHKILGEVKMAIQIANPDYDIVIKWLHLLWN